MHAKFVTNSGIKSLFICSQTVSRFSYLESFIPSYFDNRVGRCNEH